MAVRRESEPDPGDADCLAENLLVAGSHLLRSRRKNDLVELALRMRVA